MSFENALFSSYRAAHFVNKESKLRISVSTAIISHQSTQNPFDETWKHKKELKPTKDLRKTLKKKAKNAKKNQNYKIIITESICCSFIFRTFLLFNANEMNNKTKRKNFCFNVLNVVLLFV